ncbi:ABC transporter ATP-binding protein [Bacillus sp. FSL K6-6540]|uniref:ABC transporter ATP-binding protein n=1 Tax=Bacillus sp. FSL K6-6540 TaxID=2921512 RepID=UPI0030F622BB
MQDQIAISIRSVSKGFKIYQDKPLTLKEKLLKLRSNEFNIFKAVNGVSLDIKKGETVALIGHNGCGKSTLLKLITKILYPDDGEIVVNGRISSLIELGAGFHPDFTGRENIYTNASIFGLSRKEIDRKLDEIIRFSELGDFIDNPVRTYSSGMYMRLAFSVAINVDPEILLIDEILSVGDANFQKKCFDKIEGFKNSGSTIVIVTHDLGTVEKICDRVIWLDKGTIVKQGEPDRVVNFYQQHMNKEFIKQRHIEFVEDKDGENAESSIVSNNNENIFSEDIRWGSREVEITGARIINRNGEETNIVTGGDQITIEIDYFVHKAQEEYIFGMGFYSIENILVYGSNTRLDKIKLKEIKKTGTMKFIIPQCELLTGKYRLNVAIVDGDEMALDFIKYYLDFEVVSDIKAVGLMNVRHYWEI